MTWWQITLLWLGSAVALVVLFIVAGHLYEASLLTKWVKYRIVLQEDAAGRYYVVQSRRFGRWRTLTSDVPNRHRNTEKAQAWIGMYEHNFVVMQYDEREGKWEKTWG